MIAVTGSASSIISQLVVCDGLQHRGSKGVPMPWGSTQ